MNNKSETIWNLNYVIRKFLHKFCYLFCSLMKYSYNIFALFLHTSYKIIHKVALCFVLVTLFYVKHTEWFLYIILTFRSYEEFFDNHLKSAYKIQYPIRQHKQTSSKNQSHYIYSPLYIVRPTSIPFCLVSQLADII